MATRRPKPAANDENLERLLLADDATLRAIAAWTSLPKHQRTATGLLEWAPGVHYDPALWRAAAGLTSVEFDQVLLRLEATSMIDRRGEVWPPVLRVARSAAARILSARVGGKARG